MYILYNAYIHSPNTSFSLYNAYIHSPNTSFSLYTSPNKPLPYTTTYSNTLNILKRKRQLNDTTIYSSSIYSSY